MEEQKNKKVEMRLMNGGESTDRQEKQQKLTYEQLNAACMQLQQQNQYLMRQIQQMNQANMFRRLDYLFKVVELDHQNKIGSVSFASEFVEGCIKEIQEAMTIPTEEKQEDKEG